MSGAELLAATTVTFVAVLITSSYVGGSIGFGIAPATSGIIAFVAAASVACAVRPGVQWRVPDVAAWVAVVAGSLTYLLWLGWPALLPTGSGPDLAHHLLLIDYFERRGQLVDVAEAGPHLGEMSHYTPGFHLLAVAAGKLLRSDGFHALYPVIALTVALKVGLFLLILLRLHTEAIARVPLAICGVLFVLIRPVYSVNSFAHDSFLAQVVSELFAVAMWWTVIVWDRQPRRWAMGLFAIAGVAAFLTWPIWIGPPIITLAAMLAARRDLPPRERLQHGLIAVAPITAIAGWHAVGRMSWMAIVGTSGAVNQPSPASLGWWLIALTAASLVIAVRDRRYRVMLIFFAAVVVQAVALYIVATSRGAATPYMAIKMIYLALYPMAAAATVPVVFLIEAALRTLLASPQRGSRYASGFGWALVIALLVLVARDARAAAAPPRVVSDDLWAAGRWARENVPPACVDYLVGNEYTAYWLHLAVLGNSRAAPRSGNNDTYLTEPSLARWIAAQGDVPYAIADLRLLPAEIRAQVDILRQFGTIAIIRRAQLQAGCG